MEDARRHLSILLGEDITTADILKLALDRHLSLTLNIVTFTYGCYLPINTFEESPQLRGWNSEQWIAHLTAVKEINEAQPEEMILSGLWDLTMWGSEYFEVEKQYLNLIGGPQPANEMWQSGAIVRQADGPTYELSELADNANFKSRDPTKIPEKNQPAAGFPVDSFLVVRTSALRDFEERMFAAPSPLQKSVGKRERDSLLTIIAALASLANVDLKKLTATAAKISTRTELLGARVAPRTVENHLRMVREALEDRQTEM